LSDRETWRRILALLDDAVQPFSIDADIQKLYNKTAEGWTVTLINNKGVSKEPFTQAVIDSSQHKTVSLVYRAREGDIIQVRDERDEKDLEVDAEGQFTLSIPPGDVRVLSVRIRPFEAVE
jgi:hypothetical protein